MKKLFLEIRLLAIETFRYYEDIISKHLNNLQKSAITK